MDHLHQTLDTTSPTTAPFAAGVFPHGDGDGDLHDYGGSAGGMKHSQRGLEMEPVDMELGHREPRRRQSDMESGHREPRRRQSDMESGHREPRRRQSDMESGHREPRRRQSDMESGHREPRRRQSDMESGHHELERRQRKNGVWNGRMGMERGGLQGSERSPRDSLLDVSMYMR